jgi:hypothetical protein
MPLIFLNHELDYNRSHEPICVGFRYALKIIIGTSWLGFELINPQMAKV